MSLVSLAIDYKKSSIDARHEFALSAYDVKELYSSLLAVKNVAYAVILSTCNRTEIYLEISALKAIDEILAWWQSYVRDSKYQIKDYFKLKQGIEVVRHLMSLACGLESMILGEPQILGQVKDSYATSKQNEALSKALDRLFQKVFATAKKIRSKTKIGHCPVSVAFSAVALAKKQLENISNKKVLLIGAGKTGELLLRHIYALDPKNIMLANRNIEKAQKVIKTFRNVTVHALNELPQLLKEADIIVAAVTIEKYIISANPVIEDCRSRIFIDISMPRAINPNVGDLEQNIYYCVDDINLVMEESKNKRKFESAKAHDIIIGSLEEYLEKEKTITSNLSSKYFLSKVDCQTNLSIESRLFKNKNSEKTLTN